MPRIKSFFSHGALLAFGILLALAGLEGTLRIAAAVFTLERAAPPAPDVGEGARAVRRILCLGESTTAGVTFRKEDSYPYQLERILRLRRPGMQFTVTNAGVPATTSDKILLNLEEQLDRIKPHIVVTMMGINDGTPTDPIFTIGEGLRVWKLARALYFAWRHPPPPPVANALQEDSPSEIAVPQAAISRTWNVPPDIPVQLFTAGNQILNGRLDSAERILTPLLASPDQGDYRRVLGIAHGELAVIALQRRQPDAAAPHEARYHELMDRYANPQTDSNYKLLHRMVTERGLLHVAVQYPGRELAPLRGLLGEAANLVYVDNQATFINALRDQPAGKLYLDLFAGLFGHLTAEGNAMLAMNVANAILERVPSRVGTAVGGARRP